MGKDMEIKFKPRDLKVYSSNEWMADGSKKYRRVFDRYELSFIYVEFSFYNKLFDEEDWDITITLECFVNTSEPIKLCSLQQARRVRKDENIVYIRESWGAPEPGKFWKTGDFRWEVWVNNSAMVAETKFYVEDLGPEAAVQNNYFELDSVRLFESDAGINGQTPRRYYRKFRREDTRFVCAEVKIRNKSDKGFFTELFFNFYNQAGLLKGTGAELRYLSSDAKNQEYIINCGWGSSTPGSWMEQFYSVEIIFLNKIIATIPFTVGDEWEEGNVELITGNTPAAAVISAPAASITHQTADKLLQESLAELNALTGLGNIKNEVNEMVQLVRFYQETGKDLLNRFSLHTVFAGNPGTGKTTVARLLSRIYKGLGVLKKGHLVEVDREALVAGFVGQTAIKTKEKLTEALGGILFIDEAYSLASSYLSQNDFGGEAIATILKYMEDNRGNIGVIVAGYTHNMQDFIRSNPGLRSRFDKYFEFGDYTPGEMYAIASAMFAREDTTPDVAAASHLQHYFAWIFKNRNQHFGNARTVRQVVAECVKNQHLRLAGMPKEARNPELMKTIVLDDVKEFEIKNIVDEGRSRIGFR